MRTLKLLATTLLVATLAATPMAAFAGNGNGKQGNGERPMTPSVAATALVPLTQDEIDTLLWMREEEKLARDVYIKMTEKYSQKIFSNIAASEQKHFDAIGRKLVLYGVTDVAIDEVGKFYDPDLQALYEQLVSDGLDGEYVDALWVGVTIEEADLIDLTVAIDGTTSRPLKRTYSHLLIGSQHHLDSFIRLLEKEGVDYEP